MTPAVMIAFSRDHQFLADLPAALGGKIEVRACDSSEELRELSPALHPSAVFADLRRVTSSSAPEVAALAAVREKFPLARFGFVGADNGVFPWDKWGAATNASRWTGGMDQESLLRAVRDLVTPAPESPNPDASSTRNDTDLQTRHEVGGFRRRLETQSSQFQQMLADLEVAARHDVTILLIGETGVGKTYLSRMIHDISPRRDEPFVTVACGALPADLIESELFGHVKGAFTSAHADKPGKFLAAGSGSLLLDEIDVLGPEQQVKLLRVIETGEFEPVGSNATQHSAARLIVASNLDLQPLVERHRFRPDLYYRLNMLKFEIPPLRRRTADIVPLAHKFLRQFARKHQVRVDDIDSCALDALTSYPWPGNVRELEHVIQRAVIYCQGGRLKLENLPSHLLTGSMGPTNDPTVVLPDYKSPARGSKRNLGGQIAVTERDIIQQTLFNNSFSRTRTAKDLGISRVTLYNKMKRYGITN